MTIAPIKTKLKINKSKPNLFPFYYSNYIQLTGDNNYHFYFKDDITKKTGQWTVEIVGKNNILNFKIYPTVNYLKLGATLLLVFTIIIINFLSYFEIFNIGNKKNVAFASIGFSVSSFIIPLLLTDKPFFATDIFLTMLFSLALLIISSLFYYKSKNEG